MICAVQHGVVTRFHSLRAVRAMVLGLCVLTSTPLAAAWAPAAPPLDCHDECCPDGLRPASQENCCVAAPDAPSAPASVRVTVVSAPSSVPLMPVVAWSDVSVPPADVRTADPPLRSMPVLLRTSVLLI